MAIIRFLMIEATTSYLNENNHPPLGLAYIAGSLRKEYGNNIEMKIIRDNLIEGIESFRPDIVGISSVTRNYGVAREHARISKQVYDLPVIIGGVHISFMPQMLTTDMDVGIVGEGENTIVELMASFILRNGFVESELSRIKGIMYREAGKVTITEPRPLIKPIDDIPYPARDLLTIERDTSMMSSRGCPYNCAFCSTSRYTGRQVRYASAEYVANEIEILYRDYGAEYITIPDDLFALGSERTARIVELLDKKNILGKVELAINIRSDYVTEELVALLKRMGVTVIALGVETGCQQTLDYLKSGGITVEDSERAIRIVKKYKITPYCLFIIGSPNEDKAAMRQTVDFIKRNRIKYFDVATLTPYPGTSVWEYALSKGLVSEDMDWSPLYIHKNRNPIILSEKMSKDEIFEVYDELERRKQKYLKRDRIFSTINYFKKKGIKYTSKRVMQRVRKRLR